MRFFYLLFNGAGDFERGGEMMHRRRLYDKYLEYERRKAALPPMSSQEYEAAIREICRELGI